MSRDSLLYLDDLIAAAEKIGRLVAGRDLAQWQADEAAADAVLFNLQVIGESSQPLRELTGPGAPGDSVNGGWPTGASGPAA